MKFSLILLPIALCASLTPGHIEITGKVTGTDREKKIIAISGVRVYAGETEIKDMGDETIPLSELKDGVYLNVTGESLAPGAIEASSLRKSFSLEDRISGTVGRTDSRGRVLTVGGITVEVPMSATIGYATSRGVPQGKTPSLNDLIPGSTVECRGEWSGTAEFTAEKVTAISIMRPAALPVP